MSDNGNQTFGRFFEEFEVGDVYRNWPGRTISEADDTWFSLLTQNQNPIHIDANYAENHTAHQQCLVNGILVFAIVIGQCVPSVSGRAIAALEYEKVTHEGSDVPWRHDLFGGGGIWTSGRLRRVIGG